MREAVKIALGNSKPVVEGVSVRSVWSNGKICGKNSYLYLFDAHCPYNEKKELR